MILQETHLDSGFATYAWRLGVTMFFVVANGFFVAAEFALVKVRGARLDAMVAEGDRRARTARHILDHLDHYLSACQLGITIASLVLGWLAEPAVAQVLLAGVHAAGFEVDPNNPVVHAVSLALALTIVTILHMTIGEQAPKIWAIRRAESTTLWCAYPLRLFSALFVPFIWFINAISNWMLRLAGLRADEHGEAHDVEEIKHILVTAAAAGQLSHRQVEFAANVLNLVDIETRHILVPRVDAAYLSTTRSFEDNVAIIRETGHSRFPLCDGDLDSVLGVVHVKDLTRTLLRDEKPDLAAIARPPTFVAGNKPLSRLIRRMQRDRNHCVIVLDEYGTTVGLAFLEDALEHVVGTIRDEFDEEPSAAVEAGEGSTLLPGGMSLPEALDRLDLQGLEGSADTIGGYVVERLGKLPEVGDEVAIPGFKLVIHEVGRHRVSWLRLVPYEAPPDDEDESEHQS